MDQSKALTAAEEAFDLWQQDRLEEAERRYRDAIGDADAKHFRTADIHAQYAAVLTKLGRFADATLHYERALQLELRHDRDESSAPVVVARYVLGEHYLRIGDADSARRVVGPSLSAAAKPLAWIVEAEALWLAGSVEDARSAGERALALAANDEQRDRIRDRLAEMWAG